MKNRNPINPIPPELSEEYDDYVDDALDLANKRLPADREAAMRARMAVDPIYRGVIQPIVDAHEHPDAVTNAELDEQWRSFRQRAGLTKPEDDLTGYHERIRVRQRAWERRAMLFAAGIVLMLAIPTVGYLYESRNRFERVATAAYVTSEVALPDGSIARLEPSSSIRFRTGMLNRKGEMDRSVELNGSAEFEVLAHRTQRNFVVLTPQVHLMVLGTKFRVENQVAFTQVTVYEGAVRSQRRDAEGNLVGSGTVLQAGSLARIYSDRIVVEGPVFPPMPNTPK